MLLGCHLLKSWSSTQTSVSLSSGEAGFYGVVKAAGVALGQQSLLLDLGHRLPVRVWTDSSAALGICQRQGLGKLRHIQTQALWVQQKVRDKSIELRKVRGEVNPADLFTKFLSSKDRIDSLVLLFGCEFRGGRPASAPLLRTQALVEYQDRCREVLALQKCQPACRSDIVSNVVGCEYSEGVPEGELHDPDVLPHMYSEQEAAVLFPKAHVNSDEDSDIKDFDVDGIRAGHRYYGP